MRRPLLLLPRPLDAFVLGDHAQELVDHAGAAVALPGNVPYGALLRLPPSPRAIAAGMIARRLRRQVPGDWSRGETVLVAYHAIQWPVVQELLRRGVAAEAWYCRWDRYEAAQDAGPAAELLAGWHEQLAKTSRLTFCVSGALAELEHRAGRDAIVVGLSADDFPDGPLLPDERGAALVAAATGESLAPDTSAALQEADDDAAPVIASLGHLGYRTDWLLLRAIAERTPELRLLLIGAVHDDEVRHDPDYQWLRASPQVVWLGRLDDADAAAVLAQADAGIVPFAVDDFNDAGLPTRILKTARLGRPTLVPPLAGCTTWPEAVRVAESPGAFTEAIRDLTGLRHRPDAALRAWALEQTAARMNAPLHARLAGGDAARAAAATAG